MQFYSYSDLNEDLSSDLVYDVDSIKQSIRYILTTPKGSRIFLYDFGCNLEDKLHKLQSDSTAFSIFVEVTQAIEVWEPRVKLDLSRSTIVVDRSNHRYNVFLSCIILSSNQKFEYTIGLSR